MDDSERLAHLEKRIARLEEERAAEQQRRLRERRLRIALLAVIALAYILYYRSLAKLLP